MPIEDFVIAFKTDATVLLNKSLKDNPDAWSFGAAYEPFLQSLCELITPGLKQVASNSAINEQEWLLQTVSALKPEDRIVSQLTPQVIQRLASLKAAPQPKKGKV